MKDPESGGSGDTISLQLTAEDLIRAQRLHFWQKLRSRATATRLFVIWAVGTAAFAALIRQWTPALIMALVLAGVLVGLPLLIIYAAGPRAARKTFAQQKTLHGVTTVSWSATGISFLAEKGDARLTWSDFLKVRESQGVILLYESLALFRMVPKRALSSAQLESLHACIARAGVDYRTI